MTDRHYWTDGSGSLGLELTIEEARDGSHQGDCEGSVRGLMAEPHIAEQVAAWDEEGLRDHLREYGAWDDAELSDDEMNRVRTLWLACGDIVEESLSTDH